LLKSLQDCFQRHGFFVSRETLEKLAAYATLLLKWQKAINLVGPTTLDDLPERHFYDSAQLFRYIPDINVRLADLGSGAGFPGLVLALLGVKDVHLVESDVRKATFLREVSRETGLKVTIHDKRAEDCQIPDIDVITARALAPLPDLLRMTTRLATPGRPLLGLYPKGSQYQGEVQKAQRSWTFNLEVFPSETDTSGNILRIKDLAAK
jgi:16S rRNA (guanine527-N7)-methyltransferase